MLLCAALLLTLCVWRICGEPRLAFCWPFKFKIQSVSPRQELRPHRGASANSSSWYTWHYFFLLHLACLPQLLSLLLTLPPTTTSCLFVPPLKPAIQGNDAVCSRDGSQELPRQSTELRSVLCVAVSKEKWTALRERERKVFVSEFILGRDSLYPALQFKDYKSTVCSAGSYFDLGKNSYFERTTGCGIESRGSKNTTLAL